MISGVVQLKMFLIVTLAGGLLTGVVLYLLCSSFSWETRRRKLIGFFFQMSWWDTLGLACCFVKVFLFLSIILDLGTVEPVHIITYLLLELGYLIHRRSFDGVPADVLLGMVSAGVLLIMNMLSHYLAEIVFDKKIFCVAMLLGLVLLLLSLCDLVRCCSFAMKHGIKKAEQERMKANEEQKT